MRYARNLANGAGLVWNPGGERIEGYTNPLWVVFMALFHLFPIPASKMSLSIQASGAIFLIANLFFVQKIAERLSDSWMVGLLAVILTAFYLPLNNWGLQGMEVSILTLITGVAVWLSLQVLRTRRFSPWLFVLLGISTLIRIDMTVPYLVILVFLLIAVPEQRKPNLVWGLGLLAAFLLFQTLFRLWYYGDLLPNTYYLKMTGSPLLLRIGRGLFVLGQFILSFNWILFGLPLAILIFRRDGAILLPFLLILGQLAYSVYVGGDAWEHRGGSNRYISIGMPAFFILFVYTADLIRKAIRSKFNSHFVIARSGLRDEAISRTARTRLLRQRTPRNDTIKRISGSKFQGERSIANLLTQVGFAAFLLASMINFNFEENFRSLERWALLRQPTFIEGNKEYVQISLALEKITTTDAKIAVVSAGAIPYFTDRHAIDLLGKSDAKIAHLNARRTGGLFNLGNFRPGHMKWDYDYSIGELKPDVVVQLWGDTEEAQGYLDKYYVVGGAEGDIPFNLRRGSENVLWERVQLVSEES
jgi:hypothetical protein